MVKKKLDDILEKVLVPTNEYTYKVPDNWVWVDYHFAVENLTSSKKKLKQREYNKAGSIPVIDQGVRKIGGYTDRAELIYDGELPVIIFGDHTKCIKFIDFIFVQGADGVKVLRANNNLLKEKYLYYLMLNQNLPDKGYSRHYKFLKETPIQIAPKGEQNRIISKIGSLFSKIERASELIEEAREEFENRKASIIVKAFRGELTIKWREKNPNTKVEILKKDGCLEKCEFKNTFDNYIEEYYKIPDTWQSVMLKDVVQVNPKKMDASNIRDEQLCTFIPMASVSAITGEIEVYETRKFSEVKKGYTNFLEDDVLFAKITPCMENGKVSIAKDLINRFGYGSTEFYVLRSSEYILTKYLYYLVRSQTFRGEAKSFMSGAVGQQRVPKSFIEEYFLGLPSIDEQKEIVRILDNLLSFESEIEELTQLEDQIELLKKSILAKAFRGKLGTNDPTEESAMELLKETLREKLKNN